MNEPYPRSNDTRTNHPALFWDLESRFRMKTWTLGALWGRSRCRRPCACTRNLCSCKDKS